MAGKDSCLLSPPSVVVSGVRVYVHFDAVSQLIATVRDDLLTCREAFSDFDTSALRHSRGHRLNLCFSILHEVNKGTLRTALNRGHRDNQDATLDIKPKFHIHKLIWKQDIVFVVKHGFQLGGTGGDVDLV